MIVVLGFDSRRGLEIFLFTTAVTRALSFGVKRPGSEADYSPPSTAEVKE
jgi:hypothetical protein